MELLLCARSKDKTKTRRVAQRAERLRKRGMGSDELSRGSPGTVAACDGFYDKDAVRNHLRQPVVDL